MSLQTKKWGKIFWYSVEMIPIIVPAVIATFGSVAIFFLLLGRFNPWFIWPLGLTASIIVIIPIVKHYPRLGINSKARRICNTLVILGVLGWGVFNIFFTAQHILVNRDPALYSNAGIWLTHHDNLRIPVDDSFGNVPGVQTGNGSGFKTSPQTNNQYIYAQGLHLLPAFIGLAGRILGIAKSLHINVLFGMTALLGVYALARSLVKRPWWAVVGTAVVAASMPLIYFSRDTYSEPLAATLTFGGLSLLWVAVKSKKPILWFLAGLVIGAGTLTRIDGFLTVAEILAFLVIVLCLTVQKKRPLVVKQSVALFAGMAITSIIGGLDLYLLSAPYFLDLHKQFTHEMLTIIAIIISGLALVWLCWSRPILRRLDKVTRLWRSEIAAIAVIAIAIILISRPLWITLIGGLSQYSYAKYSAYWTPWYIGSAISVLGVIGLSISAAESLRRKHLLLTASLIVVIGTSLVYLIRPSIALDQIWAARRLLPVILPGIVIFGVLAIDWLYEQYADKVKYQYVIAGLCSVALVITPLTISRPLIRLKPFEQLGALNSVCQSVPRNAAILWLGSLATQTIVQPTRGVCGIASQGYLPPNNHISQKALAELAHTAYSQNKIPIIGMLGTSHQYDQVNPSQLTTVANGQYSQLQHTVLTPPRGVVTSSLIISLGMIQPNGSIVAIH